MTGRAILLLLAGSALANASTDAGPSTFSGVGGTDASGGALNAMSAFRAAIGGANNGSGGSYPNGFRAIGWDAVPDADAAPNLLPANFFNSRGVLLITPGTGVEVSARVGSGTPVRFGNIDASYTNTFVAFSPEQLFTPIDSNIVQMYFFVPGTDTPAFTRGFGAIFDDVRTPNATSIRCFGLDGSDLGKFFVPTSNTGGDPEFLGILFPPTQAIGHVVITLGTDALGAGVLESPPVVDLVVMDDLTFAEPHGDRIFEDGFQ